MIDKPMRPSDAPHDDSRAKDAALTIRKMAKQYNLTFRTLRFYESIGLLHPARKGTARLYSLQDCKRLEMTLRGRMLGFSLSEIHNLIETRGSKTEGTELEFMLESEQLITQIRSLEKQRDELDEALRCLRKAYEKVMGLNRPSPQRDDDQPNPQ